MDRPVEVELDLTLDEALEALSDGADAWNGTWHRHGGGGHLTLPVAAGIRHGVLHGEVSVQPSGEGVRVTYHVERAEYQTNAGAVLILALGALGVLAMLAWPLLPGTSPNLAGSGFIMILLAWLVVGSRLRHRGAADFLASLGPRPGETPKGPFAPRP
ncbi:MAG: hypothetical protein F4210_05105 [Holophagales bacterium]|nr:hypothetical protein [Holophagales bacterium]MYF94881.1 hypothetical protein [Holophagales bacterium]